MHKGLFDFPQIALATGGTTDGILRLDCSEFVTLVYKAAGVVDPNGRGYNGTGYTGTLVANGTRTSNPQPGDLVFYGTGPPTTRRRLHRRRPR
jgi:cell wall-associated NlpC family hydrolase